MSQLVRRGFHPAQSGVGQQDAKQGLFNPPLLQGTRDFYNQTAMTGSVITLTANLSQRVLPANRRRQMVIVQNLDTTPGNLAFVTFGNVGAVGAGFALAGAASGAGGNLLLDYVCPYTDVYVISAAAISLYVGEAVFIPEAGR